MVLKRYEIKNYSEYIIDVSVGKRKFSIPFTGGALTNRGSIPASYTTNNGIIQYAIENSKYFASGKIYLAKETKTGDDIKSTPQAATQATNNKKSSGEVKTLKKVKVSDLQEAKNYLIEKYNVNSLSLRGEKTITEQAKILGIEFIID
ncbi:MAG: hypothetical protein E7083_07665 [Bacteroidales bacterium]|nr:hypothetical protein [Bacteroidales bacterium]